MRREDHRMSKMPCESCANPMFSLAVSCPHCGMQQRKNDPMCKDTPMSRQTNANSHPRKLNSLLSPCRNDVKAWQSLGRTSQPLSEIGDTRVSDGTWTMDSSLTERDSRFLEIVLGILELPLLLF